MRLRAFLSGAAAVAILAMSGTAAAQDRQDREERRRAAAEDRRQREYQAVWVIAPSEQPLGPRSVNDGEYVFRNRLLPLGLVRLQTPAAKADGEIIVPAGAQLFAVLTEGPPIYCVAGRREADRMVQALIGGGVNRQLCLVDMDRDQDFDGWFRSGNQVRGVPNFAGHRPRELEPVSGAAYERLRPDEMEIQYHVGVRYEGTVGLLSRRRTPVFAIVYGTEDSLGMLTEQVRPQRDSDPFVVTPLGAEFVVNERRGDTIDIDVRRNVPPQPFGVVQTVTYTYY